MSNTPYTDQRQALVTELNALKMQLQTERRPTQRTVLGERVYTINRELQVLNAKTREHNVNVHAVRDGYMRSRDLEDPTALVVQLHTALKRVYKLSKLPMTQEHITLLNASDAYIHDVSVAEVEEMAELRV